MLKHHLTSAALCLALLGAGASTAYAQQQSMTDSALTETVASMPEGQTEVEGDWVNSSEVNTVEESAVARKMSQAEKVRNAEENDKYGGAITIIAMCIVIGALVVLSILFMCFGKISSSLMSRRKEEATGVARDPEVPHHDSLDSGEAIAAISAALAEHFGQGHDMEHTILTIRRLKRAYSPWNSKIYNLRQAPELHRNKR